MYDPGLITAVNAGVPTVVLTLTSTGRLMTAGGVALIVVGLGRFALTLRATRLVERTFDRSP